MSTLENDSMMDNHHYDNIPGIFVFIPSTFSAIVHYPVLH